MLVKSISLVDLSLWFYLSNFLDRTVYQIVKEQKVLYSMYEYETSILSCAAIHPTAKAVGFLAEES